MIKENKIILSNLFLEKFKNALRPQRGSLSVQRREADVERKNVKRYFKKDQKREAANRKAPKRRTYGPEGSVTNFWDASRSGQSQREFETIFLNGQNAERAHIREASLKMQKNLKGIKIKISGRLKGVNMARKLEMKKGNIKAQTINSFLDYKQDIIYTKWGVFGFKIAIRSE